MATRCFSTAVGLAAIVFCATSSNPGAATEIHGGVHPVPAVILQVIKAFDNPEAAIFSADGSSRVEGDAVLDPNDHSGAVDLAERLLRQAGPEILRNFGGGQ